jgi:DNA-directed RNA polymerase specialized sigma24 family protein
MLELRYFEDLSLQEIAELKMLPLGTVKSTLHRATRSLKLHFEGMEGPSA